MKSSAVFVLAAVSASAQYGYGGGVIDAGFGGYAGGAVGGGCATGNCIQTVTKIVDVPQVQIVDRPVPVPTPNPNTCAKPCPSSSANSTASLRHTTTSALPCS